MAKSTKICFGWGSAPDPAEGAYDAPQTLAPPRPSRLRRSSRRLRRLDPSLLTPSAFGCLTEAKAHPTSSFWRRHWPLCLHHGMQGSTPRLHALPSTAGAAGRTLLPGLRTQPPQPLLLLLECFSCVRHIFLNFVTFSTKHGSTSDKAYSRLLESRSAHANAHRQS